MRRGSIKPTTAFKILAANRRKTLRDAKAKKQLPRDKNGYLYLTSDDGIKFRATECCGAIVTYSDDVLVCKGCFREVDEVYMLDPVL